MSASPPLILTLKLDSDTSARFNALRSAYFPPERNFIPAHITLFHALPGDQEASISDTLQKVCDSTAPLPIHFPSLRSLGRGVAAQIDAPDLLAVRQRLARTWDSWLSPQDHQGYRPHLTIQNKVTADEARRVYQELAPGWSPIAAQGEGLLLWRYMGGPWEFVAEFPFIGTGKV